MDRSLLHAIRSDGGPWGAGGQRGTGNPGDDGAFSAKRSCSSACSTGNARCGVPGELDSP